MERQLSTLVSGLLERGYRVKLIARSCELPGHPSLRWVRVPGPARPFVLAYPWFFLLGSLLVMRHREGLLHTTGAIVLNKTDLSTVHLCHHGLASKAKGLTRAQRLGLAYKLNARLSAVLSRAAERLCYRPSRTGRLVAVSSGLAQELGAHFQPMLSRISVIPNGVDYARFRPDSTLRAQQRMTLNLPSDALVALFVGGEWEGKGLRQAIEGVARARNWQLLVVGSGDVDRYRSIAESTGAGERTHFVGVQKDTAPFYRAADAFLLPSIYESFSLVTLEAAATGLPLLVTRVSGVAEDVVESGVNGWFIKRESDDIAARLDQLREDPISRGRMGAAARAAASTYGWEQVVDHYDQLYRELV